MQTHKGTNNSVVALKSGFWFTVCNIITKGIGFFTTPIFSRLLTKSEFGDYNNFTTWTGIVLFVTSLNLESSLIRARFDFKEDIDSYVTSMSFLSMLSTAFWFLIMTVFVSPFESLFSMDRVEMNAMFLYLFFYPAIQLFQTKERYLYKYKSTIISSLLVVASTAGLSVVLVVLFENKLFGRIIGSVIPVAIIGAVIWMLILKESRKIQVKYWKYALPFTLPFIPHLLSMYLLGSMDKVMIKQICGSEDLALYSLAYTVGTIISLLVHSMNNAFSPWLGEQLSEKNYEKTRRISVVYVMAFTFFSILFIWITPEVLFVLGDKGYIEAQSVIPQIFAGTLMQFIYCMYVNVEQFEKKTGGMAIASVIAALFNYITNAYFIRQFGYIAASYTTFFSYLFLMLLHVWLVRRIGREKVFNNLFILIIGLIGSVVLILASFVFEYTILRYSIFSVLIVLAAIILYRYRTVVKNVLKRGK